MAPQGRMRDRFAIADPYQATTAGLALISQRAGLLTASPEGEAARSQKSLFHTKGRLFYLQPMDVTAILWYTISVKVGRYRTMRVLGIDPGYAIVGWGVVEYISNRFAPIGYGAVITEKDTPFEQRLVEIYESVFDICKRYQPEALSIEKLYYQHNQTTVIGVAEARGVILLAAAQCGVPIYEYTPMQVKQAITGYGKAVKKQIQEMTRIMLHLESVPKPDDTADALGMAIAHCHCSRSRLMGTPVR